MEEAGSGYERAQEMGRDFQPGVRRRLLTCPECGYEKTLAEAAREDESRENESATAWGNDEGPWEG